MARSRKSRYAPDYRILLSMIVEARDAAGVTQAQLSKALGTSQSMVSKMERGVVRMDLSDTLDYLMAIGADPIEFLRRYLSSTRSQKDAATAARRKTKKL